MFSECSSCVSCLRCHLWVVLFSSDVSFKLFYGQLLIAICSLMFGTRNIVSHVVFYKVLQHGHNIDDFITLKDKIHFMRFTQIPGLNYMQFEHAFNL